MTENNSLTISEEIKACNNNLQRAIFYMAYSKSGSNYGVGGEEDGFYGRFFQELSLSISTQLPTAAIGYDKKNDLFKIMVNPIFFNYDFDKEGNKLGLRDIKEQIAIVKHEVLHFTNKHLFRMPFGEGSKEDDMLYNIAGDMAINQYIKHLPKGCIDVAEYKLDSGEKFPTHRSMEEYYELLKNNKKNNKEKLGSDKPLDEHSWIIDGEGNPIDPSTLSTEEKNAIKKKLLDEAKKVIERTIEKTSTDYSQVPHSVRSLLEELKGLRAKLDYKGILKAAIQKTVSFADRASTWTRPNKRYGSYAPGTKLGNYPMLSMYIDTSGSISHTELNSFLRVIDGFLQVGSRKCQVGLWHTELYYKKPYKKGQEFAKEEVQSGGTDIKGAIEDIATKGGDLNIIFTDGYFEEVKLKGSGANILFIISQGGNPKHPMKKYGKTISLEGLL